MAGWLLKTEPSTYSFADLERDGTTVWDGVANAQALIYLRQMQLGDQLLIYHSGDERAVVGRAEIVSTPYPDPQLGDPKRVVVDVQVRQRLPQPIALAAIKADPAFAQFGLVRLPRLSVMPVPDELWAKLQALGSSLS
ncbi:MAG: EVE domain-containing protein [Chloroflexi bacterium]|nr:MAG: EVE domain-containing protein [Chloroflexota bacterium]